MGKKLSLLFLALLVVGFAANAVAQESNPAHGKTDNSAKVSADGSYNFEMSYGIGLQYGMTFTQMDNWNDYLLKANFLNYWKANFVADHELYIEITPIEGLRISAFGGWQSLYLKNTGYNLFYGGLEPAFSVRRSFYEFAVGLGLGYGMYKLDNKRGDIDGHGMLVRPFVEGRVYPSDWMAIYLRVGFSLFKSFKLNLDDNNKVWNGSNAWKDHKVDKSKLTHAGPYVAAGVRFGYYPTPILIVGDTDNDGILNDIDVCPTIAGTAEFDGCPNPDTDKDGLCDPWVSENNLNEKFTHLCKGMDKCAEAAEDLDGFEDEDGCTDADNDKDGLCDPWVTKQGMSEKFADICKGTDRCPDEAEDLDGFEDEDGCPDADNDKDGFCDPWVEEKALTEKYASQCKGKDLCPDMAGTAQHFACPDPDADKDNYCEAWVFERQLQSTFSYCKGIDQCPNEVGEDNKGCKIRRVEVTADEIRINEKIFFALNKATIKPESNGLLMEIADVFKANPQIKKVEIQGHTDMSGKPAHNMKLSNDRAKAVQDRLVKLGVEKSRLTYKGYGMTKPLIAPQPGQKESKDDAAVNRRVNFIILEQDAVTKTIPVTTPAATTPAPEAAPVKKDSAKKTTTQKVEDKAKAGVDKAKSEADKAAAKAKAEAEAKAKAAAKAAADSKAKAKDAAKDAINKL